MMTKRAALQAYGGNRMEDKALAARPQELISLLFDGAINHVRKAKLHMQNGDNLSKSVSITGALTIVTSGLGGSLDFEKGGDIAVNLSRLYDYIGTVLIEANSQNNSSKLEEAERLLSELASGWKEMAATHH